MKSQLIAATALASLTFSSLSLAQTAGATASLNPCRGKGWVDSESSQSFNSNGGYQLDLGSASGPYASQVANGKFRAACAGRYILTFNAIFLQAASGHSGAVEFLIVKNGLNVAGAPVAEISDQTSAQSTSASAVVTLNVGDTVEVTYAYRGPNAQGLIYSGLRTFSAQKL